MKKEQGFTLIELLIVIVILGILAGVVIAVINPARQQKRANEGVVKANVDKMALALKACVSSSSTPTTQCDSVTEVGVVDPDGTPTGSTYDIRYVAGATPYYEAYGVVDGCTYYDRLDASAYTTTKSTSVTGNGCVGSW